ncbi:unnamed protein product [Dimorphilus gyrociliatus]|uniref:Uncharacterized protein n=1 Tax=Dimorphilus gyrociliatus TaxID=2664684 RepID=A0A7I8VP92_9ANNE|nr:unnamed protein product [Dimorphilus gyrociliatus]
MVDGKNPWLRRSLEAVNRIGQYILVPYEKSLFFVRKCRSSAFERGFGRGGRDGERERPQKRENCVSPIKGRQRV